MATTAGITTHMTKVEAPKMGAPTLPKHATLPDFGTWIKQLHLWICRFPGGAELLKKANDTIKLSFERDLNMTLQHLPSTMGFQTTTLRQHIYWRSRNSGPTHLCQRKFDYAKFR
eukprot:Selendium_serpulae@DN3325_c0_g1_i3.p3